MIFKRKVTYTVTGNILKPNSFKRKSLDTGIIYSWSLVLLSFIFLCLMGFMFTSISK